MNDTQSPTRAARIASQFLEERLGPDSLPLYVPGEPHRLRAAQIAVQDAEELLARLEEVLDKPIRGRRAFREDIVPLLQAWRPGTQVDEPGFAALSISSPGCPFAAAVALDPRACEHCQLAQEFLVREPMLTAASALPGGWECAEAVRRHGRAQA